MQSERSCGLCSSCSGEWKESKNLHEISNGWNGLNFRCFRDGSFACRAQPASSQTPTTPQASMPAEDPAIAAFSAAVNLEK
jgi:hypothetical protein